MREFLETVELELRYGEAPRLIMAALLFYAFLFFGCALV